MMGANMIIWQRTPKKRKNTSMSRRQAKFSSLIDGTVPGGMQ
jgi:hypothetical protein